MSVPPLRRFLDRSAGRLLLAGFLLMVPVLWGSLAEAQTFKNPTILSTNSDPNGVATGDLNGDGNLDLVYVSGSGTEAVHILLGKGDGNFTHGQDIALPTNSGWGQVVNLADVTHDGKLDIILGGVGSSVAQVAVLVGNGDGTFQTPIISTLPTSGGNFPALDTQFGIGDVNGDGAADLVVPDATGAQLYVLLGNNTGKFTVGSATTFYFTGQTLAYLLDLNGDGHLDILINDRVGATTYVLLGNGDGTFQQFTRYTSYALLLADVDGDGHPDLVANVYPGQIEVLKGNADGTFGAASVVATVPANAQLVAIADYNGDGNKDLVFTTPTGVGIMLGLGNLSYGPMISSVAGVPSSVFLQSGELAEADFNRDGHNDLVVGVVGGIEILLGKGDGTFGSADFYDVGQVVGTVAVADFNGDKLPDIAVSVPATYPRILLGTGTGAFHLGTDQNPSYGTQTPSGSMAVADFNGDGKSDLDILEVNSSYQFGQTFSLLGAGAGDFAAPAAIVAGATLVGDLNNDGRSDLVSTSGTSILSLLGQSNGTFTSALTALKNPAFLALAALADVNRDGKPDLVIYEYPSLRLWLGNGDGTFTASSLISDPNHGIYSGNMVAIADLDGDGNPDIVVLPVLDVYNPVVSSLIRIFYGNGDGTFQGPVSLAVSHLYNQVVIADVNRDNKPDLIMTDGSVIAVIANLGGRNFDHEEHYVAGQGISGLSVVDVSGDGFPDIVAANSGGTTVAVLLNQPNRAPLDGAASKGVFSVTPEPSQYPQAITLRLTLSALSGGPVPSGTVTFSADGSFITTVAIANGVASHALSATFLTAATHTLTATYNGDSTYRPESFAAVHVVSPPIYPTKTALVASPVSALTSQTVRLTATVTSNPTVPAGLVTLQDGATSLGAVSVDASGIALLDTSLLAPGVHTIVAKYQGWSDVFAPAIYPASSSPAVTVTISNTSTATTLSSSATTTTFGTVVTFTAHVSSGTGIPFGGVSFYDTGTVLGTTSVLSDGSSAFSTASLATGTHSITAAFNANATFGGSTSAAQTFIVSAAAHGAAPTIVAISLTALTQPGNAVLVARVDHSSTGAVTFLDTGTILGRAALDATGKAALPVALGSGTHKLSASFAEGPPSAPGVSPELFEQWPANGPGFSLTTSGDLSEIPRGGSRSVSVSVRPFTGFGQQVRFSCQDLMPVGYHCVFAPNSLVGGGLAQLTISRLDTARNSGSKPFSFTFGLFAFAFVGIISRSRTRLLALALLFSMLAVFSSCGSAVAHRGVSAQVISIHAASGRGSSAIIHSAHLELDTLN